MFRRIGRVAVIMAALVCAPAAAAQVQAYGTSDFGALRNVLPPGENGFDNAAQAAGFKAAGTYPPHSGDQLGMYSSLTTSVPITEGQIPQFFKDATFGVQAGNAAGTESPEPGVTVEDSLRRAVAESAQQVYPADSACRAGDQMCFDSIQFRPIGVITQPLIEWVNRPTFQQADEIQGHGPR